MRPLDDIRILAIEQYGAGPFGSLQLADLGAEIIKIEDPATGGDVSRYVPPFQVDRDSLFFETFNRGKKSLALDLSNDAGRSVFEDLVRVSDAVFSNLRGDVPATLGITYEQLKAVNKAIVCCSLSGYGMTGPRNSDPGYDYVLQGITGWMSLTGEPDGPPSRSGLSLVDYSGGYVAAISLLAGVHAARRTGVGMDCDVSLFDAAISLLTYVATWALSGGYEPRRAARSAHPSLFPFQAFETSDGWIMVACPKNKFWTRLINALGLGEQLGIERYADFSGRMHKMEELRAALDHRFLQETTDHWLTLLRKQGVPSGPVNDVRSALTDPQVEARDLVVRYEHPTMGSVRTPRSAVRVGDLLPDGSPGPVFDQHRREVLEETLGYTMQDIERLADAGAFGAGQAAD